ncbi:unnamed protein product [Symbiodinium sp. CCMP2592]|nr:unnamed protein product [Symbiodinium sp. CCMP2592]
MQLVLPHRSRVAPQSFFLAASCPETAAPAEAGGLPRPSWLAFGFTAMTWRPGHSECRARLRWDELSVPCHVYRRTREEVLQVPNSLGFLLAWLCWPRAVEPSCCFLYLHGFPDQSLDHRKELSSYGQLRPTLPRRLAAQLLDARPEAAFAAFNFSGTPGSDASCPFRDKTVTQELSDTLAMISYLRERWPGLPIHVIGISTGAIVASLLRGVGAIGDITITTIAGLKNVQRGFCFDFDTVQQQAFDSDGECWKEFWLPRESLSNPPEAKFNVLGSNSGSEGSDSERWEKAHLPLAAAYREDFLKLDLSTAISAGTAPLLVLHGDRDRSVPLENGQELFEAAAHPKELLVLKGGDHLLRSSKTASKAGRAILDFTSKYPRGDTVDEH